MPSAQNPPRTQFVVMLVLCGIALVTRFVVLWIYVHGTPRPDFWTYGFEPSHIAAALVRGLGFSSPFSDHGGPTSWIPPVYPCLIAASYRLFGTFSMGAVWFMLALNLLFATLTTAVIYRIGMRCFTPEIAFGGALLWAISPDAVAMAVRIWDISAATMLGAMAVLCYLRVIDERATMKDWILYGVMWGVSALTTTTLLAAMPLAFFVLFFIQHGRLRKQTCIAAAIMLAIMAPWIVRNYAVFGRLIPVRGNFGAELWMGNHPGVRGPADEGVHPLKNPDELSAYLTMGESQYVASRQKMASAWIRQNPHEFADLTFERVISFWAAPLVMTSAWPIACSVMAWIGTAILLTRIRTRTIAVPFAAVMIFFPLSYYISHAESYYRAPIEPVIGLLAVYVFFAGIEAIAPRRKSSEVEA